VQPERGERRRRLAVEAGREEVDADAAPPERSGGARTDRGDLARLPAAAARDLGRAVDARDEQPVVAVQLDRRVAERLDPRQGTEHDLVPELAHPRGERLLLALRPRHDHPHRRNSQGGPRRARFTSGMNGRRRKLLIGAVAGALVAGGGAAIGATQFGGSSGIDSQAVIDDAAKQLGVDPSKLSDALKKALADQIDALVASGKLSETEADALKQRIQSGTVSLFGGRFGFGHFGPFGLFGRLDAAATYLGISAADLRSELASGKTLAQIAKDKGKSADGLVSALVDAEKKKLDAAVAAGKLTQAQEDKVLQGAPKLADELWNHGAARAAKPGPKASPSPAS
jgi:uncharacterized protein YidB (DUF937 family)